MSGHSIRIHTTFLYILALLTYDLVRALQREELRELARTGRMLTDSGVLKWCFARKLPTDQNELGVMAVVDNCCRMLMLCDDYITAGQYKFGLHNSSTHTRRNCECDSQFYKCLYDVGGPDKVIASAIKTIYFIKAPQCFFKIHDVRCMHKYYDNNNNTYLHDGGGQYFCAQWYVSKF